MYDTRPALGVNTSHHQDLALDRMAGIHTRLMRTKVKWLEPGGDGLYLYMLERAKARGMELMIQVDEVEDANTKPLNYSQRQTKYNRIAARVAHLMDVYPEVRFWQIGNEPDAGCDSGQLYTGTTTTDRGTRSNTFAAPDRYSQGWNYAEMLKVVYTRMQDEVRTHPNNDPWQPRAVTVVTAGLTGEEDYKTTANAGNCTLENASSGPGEESWEFLQGLYNNGGARYFDVLAIHAYGESVAGRNSFETTSRAVRDKVWGEFGDNGRPIWITEFGMNAELSSGQLNADGNLNDPEQADTIQRDWYRDALAYQAASDYLPLIMAYNLWSEAGGIPSATAPDHGYGLVRENWDPRLSYNHIAAQSYLQAPVDQQSQYGEFILNTTTYIPQVAPFSYIGNDHIQIYSLAVHSPAPAKVRMIDPLNAQAYVAGLGWLPAVRNYQVAGTTGQSRNLEILKVSVPQRPENFTFCGKVDIDGLGEQPLTCQDSQTNAPIQLGTQGRAIRRLRFSQLYPTMFDAVNWTICYSVHVGYIGWMPKVCNNGWTATTEPGQNIQAVQIWWEHTPPY